MPRSSFVLYVALGCFSMMSLIGCTESEKAAPQVVTYPLVSEIPAIPSYPDSDLALNTNAVCWFGIENDAKWNNLGGDYARHQFTTQIQPQIQKVMVEKGFAVKNFENQYLTRQKRLSVDRIVLCKNFEIKKIRVQEGICYDMKLTLSVVDNANPDHITDCDIWGRSVVPSGVQKNWDSIYHDCIANLCKVDAFKTAIEL